MCLAGVGHTPIPSPPPPWGSLRRRHRAALVPLGKALQDPSRRGWGTPPPPFPLGLADMHRPGHGVRANCTKTETGARGGGGSEAKKKKGLCTHASHSSSQTWPGRLRGYLASHDRSPNAGWGPLPAMGPCVGCSWCAFCAVTAACAKPSQTCHQRLPPQLTHSHRGPDPTELCVGCSQFLLSSGCARGAYY